MQKSLKKAVLLSVLLLVGFSALSQVKMYDKKRKPTNIKLSTQTRILEILEEAEVQVVPDGQVAVIDGTYKKGVFVKHREVSLSPYIMSRYEVTQELFTLVMGYNPSRMRTQLTRDEDTTQRPVENVNWYDAVIFCNELTKLVMDESDCAYTITDIKYDKSSKVESAKVTLDLKKAGFRLPTDAEWEFAARGGVAGGWDNIFSGVNETKNLKKYAVYASNSSNTTHTVGQKEPNALGLYDMSGNVNEWCYDWYGEFEAGSVDDDPTGPETGTYKISRGGNFNTTTTSFLEVTYRTNNLLPNYVHDYLGFRICRSSDTE